MRNPFRRRPEVTRRQPIARAYCVVNLGGFAQVDLAETRYGTKLVAITAYQGDATAGAVISPADARAYAAAILNAADAADGTQPLVFMPEASN